MTELKVVQPSLRETRVKARAELTRALAQAKDAKSRYALLIDSPHAPVLVPTLPPQDLFLTIKEVGLVDSLELLHMTSPAQFKLFVDFEAWKENRLEGASVLQWLRAARTDEDDERYRKKRAGLDRELIEWVLKQGLIIHDLEEEPNPFITGATFESPEGKYLIEYTDEEFEPMRALLNDLYAENPFEAARLIEAVRWELSSELEESALRWRNARIADYGFPSLDEALSYFAFIDPDAPLAELDRPVALPEGFFLSQLVEGGDFFARASEGLSDEVRRGLARQLVAVLNAVLVADSIDPGDLERVTEAFQWAQAILSLGLEYLAKRDRARGTELLGLLPLKRIFQVGFSLGLRLKFKADRLVKHAPERCFPSPLAEALQAVRQRRPLLCEALVDPSAPPERWRPFRTLSELEAVSKAMDNA